MNRLEQQIERILQNLSLNFTPQFPFKQFTIDFAEPTNKIAVEVQGTYWHNKLKQKAKDKIKRTTLTKEGWKVIYIWEHTIKNNPQKTAEYLNKEILSRIEI